MSLEIQNRLAFGFGLRLQRWPKASHIILHVGRVESRVVLLEPGRSISAVALLLVAGLLTGWTR